MPYMPCDCVTPPPLQTISLCFIGGCFNGYGISVNNDGSVTTTNLAANACCPLQHLKAKKVGSNIQLSCDNFATITSIPWVTTHTILTVSGIGGCYVGTNPLTIIIQPNTGECNLTCDKACKFDSVDSHTVTLNMTCLWCANNNCIPNPVTVTRNPNVNPCQWTYRKQNWTCDCSGCPCAQFPSNPPWQYGKLYFYDFYVSLGVGPDFTAENKCSFTLGGYIQGSYRGCPNDNTTDRNNFLYQFFYTSPKVCPGLDVPLGPFTGTPVVGIISFGSTAGVA